MKANHFMPKHIALFFLHKMLCRPTANSFVFNNEIGICHLKAIVFSSETLKNGQSKQPNTLLNICNTTPYGYQAREGMCTVNKLRNSYTRKPTFLCKRRQTPNYKNSLNFRQTFTVSDKTFKLKTDHYIHYNCKRKKRKCHNM
jgi:hypothetical protein